MADRREFSSKTRKEALRRSGKVFDYQRPEYRVWVNMKSRCYNPNAPQYERWGGRGITVCERWREDFAAFYADMGQRQPGQTLDRIDNGGPYSPANCRWADKQTQQRNRRVNKMVQVFGSTMTLAEAVDLAPVPYNTVLYRLKRGWSVEDAVTRPARKGVRP